METTQYVADHTWGTRVGLKQPKKVTQPAGLWQRNLENKTKFLKHKTCLVAHNYTLSSVNHMYASKMVNEMLMNLCYKISMKKFFGKNHRVPGNVRGECVTTVTTQISINVIKNILKDAITVYRDLCVSSPYHFQIAIFFIKI